MSETILPPLSSLPLLLLLSPKPSKNPEIPGNMTMIMAIMTVLYLLEGPKPLGGSYFDGRPCSCSTHACLHNSLKYAPGGKESLRHHEISIWPSNSLSSSMAYSSTEFKLLAMPLSITMINPPSLWISACEPTPRATRPVWLPQFRFPDFFRAACLH